MSVPSRPLKGAIIGFGFISSRGHLPFYLSRMKERGEVEIVAVADVCEARRARAMELLPEARVYTHHEILFEEETELDFVDIATPPCDHAKISIAALNRGLHVLCEKPLTTSVAEALLVLETAKKQRRVIFPCHNYKHAPVVKAIQEVINSGDIGKVRSVTLSTFRNTHAKGVPEWKTHWRREKRFSGGGIAMDHGSHTFYLTFDWLGSYPTAVTAKMSCADDRFDTEDNFSAVLTFPTGQAHVHLSWTAGVRKVIYTIQGTAGALTVNDDDMEIAVMKQVDGEEVAQGAVRWDVEKRSVSSHWMDASHVEWFATLFDQFVGAIESGDYVGREAKEALLCIQLIENSYVSAGRSCQEQQLESATAEL